MSTVSEIVDTGATQRLDAATAGTVRTAGIAAAVIGVALIAAGFLIAGDAFNGSYLVGFMWATTIALGGLFWPLVWRLTKAGWPVGARRHMEWLAAFVPMTAILILPILFKASHMYEWMSPE